MAEVKVPDTDAGRAEFEQIEEERIRRGLNEQQVMAVPILAKQYRALARRFGVGRGEGPEAA